MLGDIQAVVSIILSVWGLIALVAGPVIFFKARKFFPERGEAITPAQLQSAVDALDFRLREAYTAEVGRLRLSADEHHREIMEVLRAVQARAEAAWDKSKDAMHKAEIVEERVNGLDREVMARLEGLQETITQMRQGR